MVKHVLLGRDGDAVAGGGTEAPIVQGLQHFAVDRWRQALNHNLLDDIASFVDRDFDHDIALQAVEFRSRDDRVGGNYGQRRADFLSGQRSVENRTQG